MQGKVAANEGTDEKGKKFSSSLGQIFLGPQDIFFAFVFIRYPTG